MTVHDGNGWARCDRGHRHWGRYGAAGLLLAAPGQPGQPGEPGEPGEPTVLLQQRSRWVSYAGSWAPPGGARDSHESVVRAALREAAEECAIDPAAVIVHGVARDDHGGWAYQTVLASCAVPLAAAAFSDETSRVGWVPVSEVGRLRLHPGFASQWPALRSALAPLTVVVDAANVMGSRPDGWWRDRVGAATRLADQIAGLALRGVTSMPGPAGGLALERWFPRYVIVLEGAAARAAELPGEAGADSADGTNGAERRPPVLVVRASGSGDDEIVRQARDLPGPGLVVTADRELRARCEAAGAAIAGPRWLLDLL